MGCIDIFSLYEIHSLSFPALGPIYFCRALMNPRNLSGSWWPVTLSYTFTVVRHYSSPNCSFSQSAFGCHESSTVSPHRNRASLEMHQKATIVQSLRLKSNRFGFTHGGRGTVYLEMHSEAVIEQVWKCIWGRWSCKLGGRNWVSLDIQLVDVIEWT